jgi:hypothetical protein
MRLGHATRWVTYHVHQVETYVTCQLFPVRWEKWTLRFDG